MFYFRSRTSLRKYFNYENFPIYGIPQDYATGFLYTYSIEKWEAWLKQFSLQTNTDYKACTRRNSNKESDRVELSIGAKRQGYKITWQQSYNCSRGGKPQYKVSRSTHPKPKGRVRNDPGSRLMDCKATLNVLLLKVDSGDHILQVPFPLTSAHTNHSPTSLADLHFHKPLPKVMEKVELLTSHSHFNQMNLKLALWDWINHELIPDRYPHCQTLRVWQMVLSYQCNPINLIVESLHAWLA